MKMKKQKYVDLYIKTILYNQDLCILFYLDIIQVSKNYSLTQFYIHRWFKSYCVGNDVQTDML